MDIAIMLIAGFIVGFAAFPIMVAAWCYWCERSAPFGD